MSNSILGFGSTEDNLSVLNPEEWDYSVFNAYNVEENGLKFGFKYFIDEMGLCYAAKAMDGMSWSLQPMGNNYAPEDFITIYEAIQNGGTYSDGTFNYVCSGLDLFDLTVTISSSYFTASYSTTFFISSYTNTAVISNVSTDANSGILFGTYQ